MYAPPLKEEWKEKTYKKTVRIEEGIMQSVNRGTLVFGWLVSVFLFGRQEGQREVVHVVTRESNPS